MNQSQSSSFSSQISTLSKLVQQLKKAPNRLKQIEILDHYLLNSFYNQLSPELKKAYSQLSIDEKYAFKCIFAIKEENTLFQWNNLIPDVDQKLLLLLKKLIDLDCFYQNLGGIVGYHLTVLKLLDQQNLQNSHPLSSSKYIHPEGLTLGKSSQEDEHLVYLGLVALPQMAEMYPVGGAGERLNLIDEQTGEALPVAKLSFLGRTLLEGLVRDLQAREYLYFKLFHQQVYTPIALMTSDEKNNHAHILSICKQHHYFGRDPGLFFLFMQPQVPVITADGHWSVSAPLTVTFKPGGHGVIWKLAEFLGVFDWFSSLNRNSLLVRQINNPLAGTDQALLALVGVGMNEKKAFGFLSCERLLNSSEGTNIVIETKKNGKFCYRLTNIEYTEFNQKGIAETSKSPGSRFSLFPSNTNILFAHIESVRKAIQTCPIPGQLINLKSQVPFLDHQGQLIFVAGGRLESTMQNIADEFMSCFEHSLNDKELKEKLKTFLLYNSREKTISTTKNHFKSETPLLPSPELAFYDLLKNNHFLFQNKCHFELFPWGEFSSYLEDGPSSLILFHPALGPLYQVIKQKIQKGRFAKGAELQLEIAEIQINDLNLEGSLIITSICPLGTFDTNGLLKYGGESRCRLNHVTVKNQGISFPPTCPLWKNASERLESVQIQLGIGAEFDAENVTLLGSHVFNIPDHHCLQLRPTMEGGWKAIQFPITSPSWRWDYQFSDNQAIVNNDDLEY